MPSGETFLTNIHAALIMPVSAMQTHGVLPFILENDTMNYVDDVACEIETSESLGCDQIQYGWQPMMTDKGWTGFAYLENLTLPEKSGKRMKNLVFRVPPPTNNAPTAVYFKLFARGMDEINGAFLVICQISTNQPRIQKVAIFHGQQPNIWTVAPAS